MSAGSATKNKDLPIIEGAPNIFNIDSFYQELFQSAAETVLKRDKLETFLSDLGKLGAKSEISKILVDVFRPDQERIQSQVASKHTADRGDRSKRTHEELFCEVAEILRAKSELPEPVPEAYGLLINRLEFLRTLASLHTGGEQATSPGPGRIDAFGNVRRLVFKKAPQVPLNAPVSFPHLWGVRQLEWFHWDGNTNSLMERNIGQAMGLGAIADLETGASTISPLNIHTLESLFSQLPPPEWPEDQFGAVDTASERYRRGATLYVQHCARCHDRQEGGQKSPDGSITYGLQEIGTDPLRARNFAEPLEHGKPFTRELQAVAAKVKNHASSEANPGEHRGPIRPSRRADPLAHNSGLRRPAAGRDLGHRSVSAQWIGAHAGRPAQAGGRTPGHASLWGTASTTPSSSATSLNAPRCPRRNTRASSCMTRGSPATAIEVIATVLDLGSSDREALLEYLKVMDPPDMLGSGHRSSSHARPFRGAASCGNGERSRRRRQRHPGTHAASARADEDGGRRRST